MRDAVLRWDERTQHAHARMLDWYRLLIRIRHEYPDVTDPRFSRLIVETRGDDTIVMRRGRIVVAATRATDHSVELDLGSVQEILASWDPLAEGVGAEFLPGGGIVALLPESDS